MLLKIVKLGANWCGQCKAYSSTFNAVKNKFNDTVDIEFHEVDIEEDDRYVKRYDVRNLPCTLILRGEEEILLAKQPGLLSQKTLYDMIQTAYNSQYNDNKESN